MAVDDASPSEIYSLSLIRYAVTFLLGSGGTGAAVALIGQEGFQSYGLATLIICIVVAVILVGLHMLAEYLIRSKLRSSGVDKLNNLYVDSMQTIGDLMSRDPEKDPQILETLAKDLRTRAELQKGIPKDLIDAFRAGTDDIATKWESLAVGAAADEDVDPIQDGV